MWMSNYQKKVNYDGPNKTKAFTRHLAYHATPKTKSPLILLYSILNEIGLVVTKGSTELQVMIGLKKERLFSP